MVIQMDNRYAIIENNVVTNVVVADHDYAAEQGWVFCPSASIGWSFVNNEFVKPEVTTPVHVLPTKEELLEKIQQLQQQIAALSE
jgi:hypothetical protein